MAIPGFSKIQADEVFTAMPLMAEGGVLLRPMPPSDINDNYLSWFKDELVTQFLDSRNLSYDDALEYLLAGKRSGLRFQFAVCDVETGQHIGSVKLGDINRLSRVSDMVTVIGNRNYWGKGVASKAIRMCSRLAFEHYNIRKFSAGVHPTNVRSLRAYTKAGFVVEAVLHDHVRDPEGLPCDMLAIACFNPAEYPVLPHFPIGLPQI